MSSVRKIIIIAALDLRGTLSDRQGAFFIFALPLAVIFIVGLVVQQGGNQVRLGLLDNGTGPLAAHLDQTLSRSSTIKLIRYHGRASLDVAVRRSDVDVGAVIPSSYDKDLMGGRVTPNVDFIALPADRSIVAQRGELEAIVSGEEAAVIAAQTAAAQTGKPVAAALAQARQLQGSSVSNRATLQRIGHTSTRQGFDYTAPANMILFIFINSLAAAGAVAAARAAGIIRRMLATPTTPGTVLIGIGAGRLAIALVQAIVIITVGTLVFGVAWGNPVGLLLVVLLFALLSTAAALYVGATAKSFEQAIAITIPIGIGLGMLGGCMWPLAIVGPTMRAFGHITPHAWAVDALIKMGARRGLGTIVTDLAVLGGAAVVAVALATRRLAKSLAT
ncbi:MAG: ABC transporter permease [Acidimicrobiales bacterium]